MQKRNQVIRETQNTNQEYPDIYFILAVYQCVSYLKIHRFILFYKIRKANGEIESCCKKLSKIRHWYVLVQSFVHKVTSCVLFMKKSLTSLSHLLETYSCDYEETKDNEARRRKESLNKYPKRIYWTYYSCLIASVILN